MVTGILEVGESKRKVLALQGLTVVIETVPAGEGRGEVVPG
jgi:hypothetical protein